MNAPTPPAPAPSTPDRQPAPLGPTSPAPVAPATNETPTAQPDRLTKFCFAIQHREGYYGPNQLKGYPNGTPAWVNHNPGNLRCDPVNKAGWEHRATGERSGFCIFPDYDTGFTALKEVVEAVCLAESPTYNARARSIGLPDGAHLSIRQYFIIRDPASDNNDPLSFAQEVAAACGVDIETPMHDLLV